jgi:hypothetical protein
VGFAERRAAAENTSVLGGMITSVLGGRPLPSYGVSLLVGSIAAVVHSRPNAVISQPRPEKEIKRKKKSNSQ